MVKVAGHILTGDSVKFEGQVHLDMAQTKQGLPKDKRAVLVRPQACILENQAEFVVIEITCCCGTKTCIKCEYATVKSVKEVGPDSDTQNRTIVSPDQVSEQTK